MVQRVAILAAFVSVVLCPAVRADVSVTTSLALTNLQIMPSLTSGSFEVISPIYGFSYASVEDSISGSDQNLGFGDTSVSASTLLANASAADSATALTASASNAITSLASPLPRTHTTAAQTDNSSCCSDFRFHGHFRECCLQRNDHNRAVACHDIRWGIGVFRSQFPTLLARYQLKSIPRL